MSKPKKTLAAFRELHDKNVVIPARLNAALKALAKEDGPEAWEYEAEFLKRAGVSNNEIGPFREQFEPHVVEAPQRGKSPKRAWFPDVKNARAMREKIG